MRRRPAKFSPFETGVKAHRASFTIGAEGSNIINVGIQLKDQDNADIDAAAVVRAFLSENAAGTALVTQPPSGGVVIGTDGLLLPVVFDTIALLQKGSLAIHSTAEQFVTGQSSYYRINGIQYTKAATTALTFTAAHTVTANKFGVILVQINAAGTISTKVPGATQAYDSAPLALAALPSPDAGNVALGYIAIANNTGDWVANTDDLTNGSDLTTATFVDAAEIATSPRVFDLVSESDGDIDINITHSGAKTLYVGLILPTGEVVMSDAVTFAA